MRAREAAMLILLAGCDHAPQTARDPSVAISPIALGAVSFERADGSTLDLGALHDRPRILHFWATWCAPCRRELPSLRSAADLLDDDAVLAISVRSEWAEVRQFFDGEVPDFVVRERSGELARTLGVSTLPDTYVIDQEHRAVLRIAGALDWDRDEHRAWLAATLRRDRGS